MPFQCCLPFRSLPLRRPSTISTLDIPPRLPALKLESRSPCPLSRLVSEKLSCLSSLKSTLICWPTRSKSIRLTYGWSTLDGLADATESERYLCPLTQRISINNTRDIINAIHSGELANAEYDTLPIFNLKYPKAIKGVNSKILNPADSWTSKVEFDETLEKVAGMFKKNFAKFDKDASEQVKSGGPQ